MKTEKQIDIEVNKKGNEIMEEYEKNDLINVDVAVMEEKIENTFFDDKSVLIVPIVKKGVLELKNNDVEDDEILNDFEVLYNSDRTMFHDVLKEGWDKKRKI